MQKIDKNIVAMGWVSFFTDMASSMVTTLLPIFVVYVLHEGVDKLGIIIAIATFVSYALRILFGYLSDRFGIVKPFVVTGYLISALSKPFLMYAHSFTAVAGLRAFERMGKAVRSASKDALISSYAKKGASGKSFGFHKMMDVSGEMSGALIIVLFFFFTAQNEALIRAIFGYTLIPGLIGVLIVAFFVKDAPAKPKTKEAVVNHKDYRLFWVLGSYFIFLFFFLSDQFFIVEARATGMTLAQIPLLVIASTLTQALVSYYSGTLIDRVGTHVMLLTAYLFGVLSIIALDFHQFWLTFIFFGLFTVVSLNTLRAYISAHALSKGFVYGVLYGGIALSGALGALTAGYIWKLYGFEMMIDFSLIGTGSMSMLMLVLLIKHYIKDKNVRSMS